MDPKYHTGKVPSGNLHDWLEGEGGVFEQAYHFLRVEAELPCKPAFIGAWMSLAKDDRGSLPLSQDVDNYLGISSNTSARYKREWDLHEWSMLLRKIRLQGDWLGEVDRRTYEDAVGPESTARDKEVFYKRAGVSGDTVTIQDQTKRDRVDTWLDELRKVEDE